VQDLRGPDQVFGSDSLPAHGETCLGQVFGSQRGSEIRITLLQARQNLLLQTGRQLAVRWSAAQSVNQGMISSLARAEQHPPHLEVAYFQPRGPSYLRQMLLLYLVQHFQTVRSRWLKAIRSVSMGPSAIHESGHFYFAQTGHSHFAATSGNSPLTRLLSPT
jgi:hypothetical protein